jgi:tetratricopeptide (TPR) repeat protein
VSLAQTYLKLGRGEEALRQSKQVLEMDNDRQDAMLVEAQALAQVADTQGGGAARREKAVERLQAVIRLNPNSVQAYHALADVYLKGKDRKSAAIILQECLKANPEDATGATQLIQLLSERGKGETDAKPADLESAKRIAAEIRESDKKGVLVFGAAVGFYRAGQLELAKPYAELAATTLKSPSAHLNLGDLLLSIAETEPEGAARKATLNRAIEQYDLVLKQLPTSVEAVNNKAWILHSHLGKSQDALALVLKLQQRVSPALLPGEFYDTLGAIQESIGQAHNAEQSYLDGLKKAPEHPMLNYHIGKLISTDMSRKLKAKTHLNKALAASDRLSAGAADDALRLVQQLDSGSLRSN